VSIEVRGKYHKEDVDLVYQYTKSGNKQAVEIFSTPALESEKYGDKQFGTIKPQIVSIPCDE
jgi:hypothetical protein